MSDLLKRLARLPADRRAELLALLRDIPDEVEASPVPVRREHGPSYPLGHAQETIWFVSSLAPDRPTYNTTICVRLTGELDVDAWREAFAAIVARHDALRTNVSNGPEGPMQTVQEAVPVHLPLIELHRDAADERMREIGREVFDLERAPLWRATLLRVAPDEHLFLFVAHHVILDGWSWGVIFAELADLYRGKDLATQELDFGDYTLWHRDWLAEGRLEELTAFWKEKLAGAPTLEFPTDKPRPPEISYRGRAIDRVVPLEDGGIARLARALGTTANVIFTSAFFALMQRYSGASDVVIGAPTANRDFTEVESVVGNFINMLVLRTDVSGDPTFKELVERVGGSVYEAFAHGALPFGKLVEAIQPPRDPSRSPIFQIVFSYLNAERPFELPDLDTERLTVDTGVCTFDMTWEVMDVPGGARVVMKYSTDLFLDDTADDLVTRFGNVLRAVAADPDLPLSRIPLLSEAERTALLTQWNGPVRPPRQTTVPEVFAAQVARRGDAIALVCHGEQLTYAELDRRSNILANGLRDAGAGPGRCVALCLPRRTELIVAMLAVLKAGAAYVPLDPTHPSARLETIIADCDPVAVIAVDSTAGALPQLSIPVLGFVADGDSSAPPFTATPTDLAYVLFTSGSTGTPKGVMIEHHSVINFIDAMEEIFELTVEDRVLGFASATFDVSVFEIFSALLVGGQLHLATDEERLDMDRLERLLIDGGVTVTDLPPPLMALLDPTKLPALRIVFAGLEAFPGELVNRWNPGKRFFNGYGPTECTVTMVVHECPGQWSSSPPIGLPILNHVAHVLDPNGEPVPMGVPGELIIGGTGIARGYLNRPDLTAEKFYPDTFGTSPGGMLYRTGDLVKRQRDGSIMFLGRVDNQVKVRGLRIELGEIESVLGRHPAVDQASVDVRLDERGDKHLVCYLSSQSTPPAPSELRDYLSGELPSYMVPSQYVVLEAMPLNSSGKVDRKRLPDPVFSRADSGPADYASELEKAIATGIVAPLLGTEHVNPEQNFFEMGGHSLAAAKVLARVRSQYSVEINLVDFFRAPTVRGLTAMVEVKRAALPSEDELLAMLESMSDDEAAALLADGLST